MALYLRYVAGGKTSMAEARKRARELQAEAVEGADEILPIREHTQFYVQRELAALGIEAWVGRKVDFIRRGKNRFAEAIESPVLPNYVFVEMTPQQFIKAQGVKYLAPTFQMVPRQEVERVKQFQRLRPVASDEHVWAVCDYLRSGDGLPCKKCPRYTDDKKHGKTQQMCFGIAQETIITVDVTRVQVFP